MDTGFPVADERRRKKKQARARPPIRPCGPILARNELHADEAPASNDDLLDDFREAYVRGELNDAEFRRVTELLTNESPDSSGKPAQPQAPEIPREPAPPAFGSAGNADPTAP